jgi:hypothetical protein
MPPFVTPPELFAEIAARLRSAMESVHAELRGAVS